MVTNTRIGVGHKKKNKGFKGSTQHFGYLKETCVRAQISDIKGLLRAYVIALAKQRKIQCCLYIG